MRERHRRPAVRFPTIAATSAAAALLGLGLWVGAGSPPAVADTAPPSGTPATVSADALPTVQINGVVWSQVTVGNTVYATGKFTSARPAGAKAGTGETPRANLLAYDIRTGALLTSFRHSLNAQGLVVTASPDGTRVYVGGDFTTVDGQARNRLAAFDTATGSLVASFHPSMSSRVRALAATTSTVYAGGSFTTVNGSARAHLSAIAAGAGALLSWAPKADDGEVSAMVLAPGGTRLVVGGRFTTLSGQAAYGLGMLDATSGAVSSFAANSVVRDAGPNSDITSLRTDGRLIYGTGYVYGAGGNLEGMFAADPANGGKLVWVEDCHGDSYDVLPVGSVAYTVGHAHDCARVRAFPETAVRSYHRALAFTTNATQTLLSNSVAHYSNFGGKPAPTQLTWYPTVASGTVTGQFQGAWSLTGNANYIALGGEFPSVNGTAQAGLVRFAVRSVAPNRVGPAVSGLTPSLVSLESGTVRVTYPTTADPDNASLTYRLLRDGSTTPLDTRTVAASFWSPKLQGILDRGLVPGSNHTYRLSAVDALGNTVSRVSAPVTVSTRVPGPYVQRVKADGATMLWRLGETAGTAGYDSVGFNDLTLGTGVTRGAAGAVAGDSATRFNGTSAGTAASRVVGTGPQVFSVEAWVRTTSGAGGKVIGFGSSATGASNSFDRSIYLDSTGHARFGIYNGTRYVLASPGAINDGRWHHLVGTLSGSGMAFYVDGVQVATNPANSAKSYSGVWRVGGDSLKNWPGAGSWYLAGDIDEVAVYPTALSSSTVLAHYRAATG